MELHEQLVSNYRFKVLLDNYALSFARISGLGMDAAVEHIAEGGCNRGCFFSVAAGRSTKTMRMETGVCRDTSSVLRKLRPGMMLAGGIIIMVMDPDGTAAIKYATEAALVVKWDIADLDSLRGDLLIHTFEIVYSDLHLLT